MVKFLVLGFFVLAVIVAIEAASLDQCPVASKVQTCAPKCLTDADCSSIGGKCCPNTCNRKTCLTPTQLQHFGSSENKDQSEGGTGTYCGNVKCNAYETCQLDNASKRQTCTRS